MKLVVLSLNYAPELTGIGKYSGEMVQGLVARGHQVVVVCAPPYYPAWRVTPGYRQGAWQFERPCPGLVVCRCPVWVPRRPGGAARLLHLASFAAGSLPVLLGLVAWRPQAVFAVMPALFAAPGARLLAWLSGALAWLHVQDFEIDAAFELGLLRGTRSRRAVLAAERRLLAGFDTVSTISQRMLARLLDKGVPPARVALMPNGADLAQLAPLPSPSPLRERLGIPPGQRVCLYAGTMNRKQGLPVLIEAARRLQGRTDLVFVLSGSGELRGVLQRQAAGLHNVRFLELCPPEALNELLNLADIHLLPQLRGAADLVMPSKLTGMLASGRPVIAAADPGSEIASVVERCGRVVEPESEAAFAAAIEQLADDDALRRRLGEQARARALEHLDATRILDAFEAELLSTLAPQALKPGRLREA